MKDLLEIYNLEMKVQGLSDTTIKNKLSRLSRFCDYINTADNLNKETVNRYIASLEMKDRSKNEHIKTIRVFIKYLYEENYIDKMINIRAYKCDKVVQQQITDEDVNRILNYLKKDKSFLGVRNYTIVCVLLDVGLRVSELVDINVEDIEGDVLKVKCKRKERLVPISPKLKLQLKKYLVLRDKYIKKDTSALFISRSSNRIQIISIQKLMQNLGECMNIHLHAHLFRHYFIQSLLRQGVSIYYIARIVGHNSISTTEEYLRSMQQQEILQNIKSYSNL